MKKKLILKNCKLNFVVSIEVNKPTTCTILHLKAKQ